MSTLPANLRPDCARCCGLCCVAPPFDAEQGFGYDKPAHTPCRHLQGDYRCGIYDTLLQAGFPGCVVFDCFGAGQRVTQQLFGGASWAQSPEVAVKMFDAYARLRGLHELMALTTMTLERVDDADQRQQLQQALLRVEEQCNTESPTELAALRKDTLALLRQVFPQPARSI